MEKHEGCIISEDLGIIQIYGAKRQCVLAKCKCGKERIITMKSWLSTTGLCKRCRGRQYVGEISGKYFSSIRYDAKKRGIEFLVTKQYIWDLFLKSNRQCSYTGITLVFGDGNKEQNNIRTASLDRIDSSKGYVEGNIQWIHQIINFMKGQLSDPEFLRWCELITDYRRKNGKVFSTNGNGSELLHQIILGACLGSPGTRSGILGSECSVAA